MNHRPQAMMTAGSPWMAVAICQPELSFLWDMASLTMPARWSRRSDKVVSTPRKSLSRRQEQFRIGMLGQPIVTAYQ